MRKKFAASGKGLAHGDVGTYEQLGRYKSTLKLCVHIVLCADLERAAPTSAHTGEYWRSTIKIHMPTVRLLLTRGR
jgi:hypothetical protein